MNPQAATRVGAGVGLVLSLAAGVVWADVPAGGARPDAQAGGTRTDILLPPWAEAREPDPGAVRSVVPKPGDQGQPGDMRLFLEPSRAGGARGLTLPGASLPYFGSKRGPGCSGRWWLVGPVAWTCSDDADLSGVEPVAPAVGVRDNGLPAAYFFVKPQGGGAYVSLESAQEGAPDRDLEGGWALAIVEQRTIDGQRFGLTSHGLWIALSDVVAARPSLFHGENIDDGRLDFGWVINDKAGMWPSPSPKGKPADSRERFKRVALGERSGPMAQVDQAGWMLARDVAQPTLSTPPPEVSPQDGRWIDVDLVTQTLVAYEGAKPVYATLVSTGRGGAGSGSETPTGIFRIWVKILRSDMANVERDDLEAHYSLEDVPYVQFFNGAVGLHGTYWHNDFGHVKSHGCVNLSPLDARWLFAFTEPHLPPGWAASYPTPFEQGTVVRVR